MKVTVDEYKFDFPSAKELYKFDETDNLSPHYHGVSVLKAVDVMAEFSNCYLWIEIKQYTDEDIVRLKKEGDQRKPCDKYHIKSYLRNNLVGKYRDTFLYRYAEQKLDKPIFYVCLLNFDSALKTHFRKELIRFIPTGIPNNKRWKRKIIEGLIVVDEKDWVRNPKLSDFGTCKHL